MKNKLIALLALFTITIYNQVAGETFTISTVNNQSGKNVIIEGVTYSPGKTNSFILIPQYPSFLTISPLVGVYKNPDESKESQHRVYKIWRTAKFGTIFDQQFLIICNWDNDPGWTGEKTRVPGKEAIEYGTSAHGKSITIIIQDNGEVYIPES